MGGEALQLAGNRDPRPDGAEGGHAEGDSGQAAGLHENNFYFSYYNFLFVCDFRAKFGNIKIQSGEKQNLQV